MNVFLSFYGINDDDEWNKKKKNNANIMYVLRYKTNVGFF